MEDVASVSADTYQTLALRPNGDLYRWGNVNPNNVGQPINNWLRTFTSQTTPQLFMEDVARINADGAYSRAISSAGEGFVWDLPNISIAAIVTRYYPFHYDPFDDLVWAFDIERRQAVFERLRQPPRTPNSVFYGVMDFAETTHNSFVLMHDGTLRAWGRGFLTLGIGDGGLSAGGIAFSATNDGYDVGECPFGSYGIIRSDMADDFMVANYPWLVKVLENIVAVSAGLNHVLALDSQGNLWALGENDHGQVGNGTNEQVFYPELIMQNVIHISAGDEHSLAITSDGRLWAWGNGRFGRLGNGSQESSNTPIAIMNNAANASAGSIHNLAITRDGYLWAWGANHSGQLGDGTTETRLSPVQIMGGMMIP
jgi:alpha-tubulin suppressor-like RCC1 family protein